MDSLKLKRMIAKLYPVFKYSSQYRKVILIYHAVGSGPWAINDDVFRAQMRWLKEHCEIVPLTTLLRSPAKKNKIQVALTFDDGYACLYDTVLPILQAKNAVATVYINTGWMSECEKTRKDSNSDLGHYPDEKFLTWGEVKKLDQAGWEIGSHGVDHIDLTSQSEKIIKQELINSKKTIENVLKKPCNHFAYTWGKHSKIVRKAVLQSKYCYAVAAHHASIKNFNCMTLPRLNVEINYSLSDFENIVLGKWDYLGLIHAFKRCIKGIYNASYYRKVK